MRRVKLAKQRDARPDRQLEARAPAEDFGDGYAIGTSSDEGTTWQALMTYADVHAINPCLKAYCQEICAMEVAVSLWTADVCAADPPMSTGTGGSGGASGPAGKPPSSSNGGCAVAGPVGPHLDLALLLWLGIAGRRPRRRTS
jgi:hypothetical protein